MVKKMVTPPLIAYIKKNLFRVRSGMGAMDSSFSEDVRIRRVIKVARGMRKVLEVISMISLEARPTVYTNNTINPPRKIRNKM
jgi:hypothetical protein